MTGVQTCALPISNAGVLLRVDETTAELYRVLEESDSALYYIDHAKQYGTISQYGTIIKAQAFDNLDMKDSAIYYAELILSDTFATYHSKFNALYIITHNDSSLSKDSALAIASQREDIRHYEYEPQKEQFIKAAQLLKQSLNFRTDWRTWFVIILIISFGGISVIALKIWHKRKQIMEKRVTTIASSYADEIITSIKQHIDVNNLNQTLHWKDYEVMKSDADLYMGSIVSKLETYKLNEVEIRFCVLTVLDMKLNKIADTIHYSYPSGIKTLKKRIANKLGTTPPQLRDYIFKMIINTHL